MNDRFQVRVIEIKRVLGDAIHQRRARHVDALLASEHGGLGGRLHDGERPQRGVRSLVMRGANAASEPVEKRTMRLVIDGVAPTAGRARRVIRNEFCKRSRDGRRVVIGGDLGVTGHD